MEPSTRVAPASVPPPWRCPERACLVRCAWASPFLAFLPPASHPTLFLRRPSDFFRSALLSSLSLLSICLSVLDSFSFHFLFSFLFFLSVVSWDRVFTPSPRPSTLSFIRFSCSQPRTDDSSGLSFVLPTRSLPPTASEGIDCCPPHCLIIISFLSSHFSQKTHSPDLASFHSHSEIPHQHY